MWPCRMQDAESGESECRLFQCSGKPYVVGDQHKVSWAACQASELTVVLDKVDMQV